MEIIKLQKFLEIDWFHGDQVEQAIEDDAD